MSETDASPLWAVLGFDAFQDKHGAEASAGVVVALEEVPFVFDYVDVDGDGDFMNLENYPDSGDYALIAFKTISFSDRATPYFTWTNPDL